MNRSSAKSVIFTVVAVFVISIPILLISPWFVVPVLNNIKAKQFENSVKKNHYLKKLHFLR